jgi:hypothetical protein
VGRRVQGRYFVVVVVGIGVVESFTVLCVGLRLEGVLRVQSRLVLHPLWCSRSGSAGGVFRHGLESGPLTGRANLFAFVGCLDDFLLVSDPTKLLGLVVGRYGLRVAGLRPSPSVIVPVLGSVFLEEEGRGRGDPPEVCPWVSVSVVWGRSSSDFLTTSS